VKYAAGRVSAAASPPRRQAVRPARSKRGALHDSPNNAPNILLAVRRVSRYRVVQCNHLIRPRLKSYSRRTSKNLCAPVHEAWQGWEKLTPEHRRPLTPRTRANWLFDMTVAAAKVSLARPPIYTLTKQPGFLVVTVEDQVAIRYKKVDEELGISGIRTGQCQLWRDQQLTFDGVGSLTHLVVGYQVSELGKLAGVMLVCAQGYRVLWHIPAPAPASGDVKPFPSPDESPAPRVQPKRPARDDDVAQGGGAH
jgi:hypothetical protein